jgi:hypothetical protein
LHWHDLAGGESGGPLKRKLHFELFDGKAACAARYNSMLTPRLTDVRTEVTCLHCRAFFKLEALFARGQEFVADIACGPGENEATDTKPNPERERIFPVNFDVRAAENSSRNRPVGNH